MVGAIWRRSTRTRWGQINSGQWISTSRKPACLLDHYIWPGEEFWSPGRNCGRLGYFTKGRHLCSSQVDKYGNYHVRQPQCTEADEKSTNLQTNKTVDWILHSWDKVQGTFSRECRKFSSFEAEFLAPNYLGIFKCPINLASQLEDPLSINQTRLKWLGVHVDRDGWSTGRFTRTLLPLAPCKDRPVQPDKALLTWRDKNNFGFHYKIALLRNYVKKKVACPKGKFSTNKSAMLCTQRSLILRLPLSPCTNAWGDFLNETAMTWWNLSHAHLINLQVDKSRMKYLMMEILSDTVSNLW